MNIVNKEIEVVALFKKDGFIKPERFRIELEDGEEKVIHIKRVKFIDDEKLLNKQIMRKFTCVIEDNGIMKVCVIGYNLSTLKWQLLNM